MCNVDGQYPADEHVGWITPSLNSWRADVEKVFKEQNPDLYVWDSLWECVTECYIRVAGDKPTAIRNGITKFRLLTHTEPDPDAEEPDPDDPYTPPGCYRDLSGRLICPDSDGEGRPGCGETGNIACETTQQDNRGLLGEIRDLLRAPFPDNPDQTEECIIYGICADPEEPDEEYPGFGDAEAFRRDRWVAPELTEADTNQVLARIEAAGVRISEAAENKMPFALANLVPNFSGGGGGGECQETNLQMLGTSAAIGFCGSAVDTFFAGPVRGMLELVMMVGFYFSVARTYNAA
jgi:hypothetical protein